MCTWMTGLNKHSKSAGGVKRKSIVLSMKPCPDEKSFYRYRLLAFNSDSGRDDPHIERFVHQHWGHDPEKNFPVLEDEITCPVTEYVKVEGDRYDACKVCAAANKYFLAFKESNWKDKDACHKNKEFSRKYQAIVPVYVVNDPNYEGNNGKFRVIIFNDKKEYRAFRKQIEKQLAVTPVFNGKGAVDCCIHVSEVVEILNEGTPKEYHWKKKVMDRIVFSTKPYDIPAITKDMVDQMGFDDQYYTTSTPAEIDAFYKKYCTVSNDDIPMGDTVEVFKTDSDIPAKASVPAEAVANAAAVGQPALSADEFDDLTSDPDNIPAPAVSPAAESQPAKTESDDVNAADLIADLGL